VTRFAVVASPLGPLLLAGDGHAVTGLWTDGRRPDPGWTHDEGAFAAARAALDAHFAGRPAASDVPLAPAGTAFQLAVWTALRAIPRGQTRTYGELAAALGRPRAARAVGAANARNPIAILVPCHRLVGAGGALTGYAGGLERKRALLALERTPAGS
jgi:methylated-DNA-[protein]-cysteine S-methyltransferase